MSFLEFAFNGSPVRFVGTWDNPEWVAADVLDVLYDLGSGHKNLSNYLSKVPGNWKSTKLISTPKGDREMVTLLEPGLYHLIFRSNSTMAKIFQRWVFEEVLPTIRKQGRYEIEQATQEAEQITDLQYRYESAEKLKGNYHKWSEDISKPPLLEGSQLWMFVPTEDKTLGEVRLFTAFDPPTQRDFSKKEQQAASLLQKQEVDGFKAIIKLLDDPKVSIAGMAKILNGIYKSEGLYCTGRKSLMF